MQQHQRQRWTLRLYTHYAGSHDKDAPMPVVLQIVSSPRPTPRLPGSRWPLSAPRYTLPGITLIFSRRTSLQRSTLSALPPSTPDATPSPRCTLSALPPITPYTRALRCSPYPEDRKRSGFVRFPEDRKCSGFVRVCSGFVREISCSGFVRFSWIKKYPRFSRGVVFYPIWTTPPHRGHIQ